MFVLLVNLHSRRRNSEVEFANRFLINVLQLLFFASGLPLLASGLYAGSLSFEIVNGRPNCLTSSSLPVV